MVRRGSILAALFLLLPGASQAAVLMLVDGVAGPSNMPNHSGWFEVQSLSWGIDGAKEAAPQFVTTTLTASAAIAALEQFAASGTLQKRVVFDQVKLTATAALVTVRLTCNDAVFRKFTSAHSANDVPMVALALQCGKLAWENFDYNEQGTPAKSGKGSWNFVTNTP